LKSNLSAPCHQAETRVVTLKLSFTGDLNLTVVYFLNRFFQLTSSAIYWKKKIYHTKSNHEKSTYTSLLLLKRSLPLPALSSRRHLINMHSLALPRDSIRCSNVQCMCARRLNAPFVGDSLATATATAALNPSPTLRKKILNPRQISK
jgi:hypothetical protein